MTIFQLKSDENVDSQVFFYTCLDQRVGSLSDRVVNSIVVLYIQLAQVLDFAFLKVQPKKRSVSPFNKIV